MGCVLFGLIKSRSLSLSSVQWGCSRKGDRSFPVWRFLFALPFLVSRKPIEIVLRQAMFIYILCVKSNKLKNYSLRLFSSCSFIMAISVWRIPGKNQRRTPDVDPSILHNTERTLRFFQRLYNEPRLIPKRRVTSSVRPNSGRMSLQFPAVTGESVMFNMLPYSHVLEICQEQLCRNYYLIK